MYQSTTRSVRPIPRLNIVIQVVGTRGDVQPLIAYGLELTKHNHRVRIATHATHKDLVKQNQLEFYPLAGDPSELMRFMVKNGGINLHLSTIFSEEIWKNRETMRIILETTWNSCICDNPDTGVPFTADVIIANPPSFGHIHCAEKLGIPLHIVFGMPWSETRQFPHPFSLSEDRNYQNYERNRESYENIAKLTWRGLHNVINHFRKEQLKLPELTKQQALSMMRNVPHTYCWSPSLIPKPADWNSNIDVSGYFFHPQASNGTLPQDLHTFLKNGDRPLYIGFGSIDGHDRERLFKIICHALERTGRRAIVCRKLVITENYEHTSIFPIGDFSHDLLFKYVDGICHHGGAGTTAAGLRAGLPTIVIPFFGDQYFWGDVVQQSGAGPGPLPAATLTTETLVSAITIISNDQVMKRVAQDLGNRIRNENGCQAAVESFHRQLPLQRMRSDLEGTYPACFRIPNYNLQVSWPVAQVLFSHELLTQDELIPWATQELYLDNNRVSDMGTQLLAQAISTSNTNLRVLYLGSNGITYEGAYRLAEMLKTNRTLNRLYFFENNLGDHGIQLLTEALAHCDRSLSHMDLNGSTLESD
ncbi:unnamed protein product [Rotaria magnacalcarata]|uniref:Glycosyltransferase family 28 N-terminal domain-containing protein n=1 Tax=Rotaria magnacalcarata TaxID=392030 RepID=A0A819AQK2_9BILA|nr:unnamed protein product [Rotaria magnacalcarata]CAF3758526.1 unnamed protein product [Rotaria magnacalcarata]CAF3785845.1 unnamed protein product [Rotaria magnacalcarata]